MSTISFPVESLPAGRLVAPVQPGFQLTVGDLDILKLIFDYRLLRLDHLALLTGRSYKKLHGRLFKLVGRHYVARIELPLQKHIYVLGRAAVPVLVEQGLAPKELLDWRLRHHELKELFLKHQLMVVDFHTALAVATKNGPVKLVAWKEGRSLWDSVSVRIDGARARLPVRPDAFFTLEDTTRPSGQNQVHFFLEADRSTTTHQRFQRKLTAYWHYFQEGSHTAKHGIRTFRVATVTLTPDRAKNLCAAAAEILPSPARKFYLFTDSGSIDGSTFVLRDVCITPHDFHAGARHALIPLRRGDS